MPPRIRLSEILDFPFARLVEVAEKAAGIEVARQLDAVVIPVQKPDGHPTNFSVLAITHPRLTPEQRQKLALVDERDFELRIEDIEVVVSLDQFTMINWMRFKRAPGIYKLAIDKICTAVAQGDTRKYWE